MNGGKKKIRTCMVLLKSVRRLIHLGQKDECLKWAGWVIEGQARWIKKSMGAYF